MSMTRRFLMACAAATLTLSVGWEVAAFAYGPTTPDPMISLSATCATPGGSLVVTGTDFDANEGVTVTLNGYSTALGSTTTNSSGDFSITVTIPTNATTGSNTITATDTSGYANSAPLTLGSCVTTVAATSTTTTTSGLAFTGADIAGMAGVAAVAIGVGGILVLTTRRRRRTAE